jgi:predicted CoA-binding protein
MDTHNIDITSILTPPKTVAVVGLSDKPERPSFQVASYLAEQGFTIIPVNPFISQFNEILAYPSLSVIPKDVQIDIVDIFRKSEEVITIVQEVLSLGIKPVIWMQEGVVSSEAKQLAEENGLTVVMDQCMMRLHRALW